LEFLKKNRIKETTGSNYFKNLKELSVFIEELAKSLRLFDFDFDFL